MANEATSESVQTCNDEGILQPPLEIKNNIDKIASYVAKNVGGEARVLADLGKNTSFGFLHVGNPYFAYYMQKVRGERNALENQKTTDVATKVVAAVTEEVKAAEAPPKREWISESDIIKIPPLDLDVIKLVSQFVARNGQSCQMGLWNRESKNPQFGFLQPLHPYNRFFQHLVECYTRIIYPSKYAAEFHEKCASNKQEIINGIMKRRDWNRSQIKTEEERRAEEEAERSAMTSIDWNDAVIVDTITFDPSEDSRLPQPIDKSEIMTVYNMTKAREEEAIKQQQLRRQEAERAAAEAMNASMQQKPLSASSEPAAGSPFTSEPKLPANYRRNSRKLVMVCPICLQAIPADELEEHMKIELSRAGSGLVDKPNKNTTFPERTAMIAEGDEIASHLTKMAKRRKDIFGDDEDVVLESTEASAAIASLANAADSRGTSDLHNAGFDSTGHANMNSDINNYSNPGFNRAVANNANLSFVHGAKKPPVRDNNLGPPPNANSSGFAPSVGYAPHQPPQASVYMNRPPTDYNMPQPSYPAQTEYISSPHQHLGAFPPGYQDHPMLDMSGQFPPQMVHGAPSPMPDLNSSAQKRPADLDEPASEAKRSKVNKYIELVSEKEWLGRYPGAVKITILVSDGYLLPDGQTEVEFSLELSSTVKDVKEKLLNCFSVAVPINKQVLKVEELGFLKDKLSLAHYNLKPGSELILSTKERGGRKK